MLYNLFIFAVSLKNSIKIVQRIGTCSSKYSLHKHFCWFTVFFQLYYGVFSFQNNPKDLDSSYKTNLDLGGCLGRVKLVL